MSPVLFVLFLSKGIDHLSVGVAAKVVAAVKAAVGKEGWSSRVLMGCLRGPGLAGAARQRERPVAAVAHLAVGIGALREVAAELQQGGAGPV